MILFIPKRPETPKKIEKILERMRSGQSNIRFSELCNVCEFFFGEARQSGSSHCIYKTPWAGDPRVNIQNDRGKGKVYQVRQVLKAIDKLIEETKSESEETSYEE
jgi:hypothetical protein